MPLISVADLPQVTAINLRSDGGAIGGPKIVPSCAQIVLRWTQESGKPAHNILYGRYSGAFSGTVAQANAIFAALSAGSAWVGIQGSINVNTSFAGVGIRDVNSPNAVEIDSTTAAVPGTQTGLSLPNEVAIVVSLRTAFSGRANRGRMYLPGWGIGALSAGNLILAALVTNLNVWAATIGPALAAQGYTWVLGQPARQAYIGTTGTSHPARPAQSTPITQALVRDNHWDSQRRRGLK